VNWVRSPSFFYPQFGTRAIEFFDRYKDDEIIKLLYYPEEADDMLNTFFLAFNVEDGNLPGHQVFSNWVPFYTEMHKNNPGVLHRFDTWSGDINSCTS